MTHQALGQQQIAAGSPVNRCTETVSELVIPHPYTVFRRNSRNGTRHRLRAYSVPKAAVVRQVQLANNHRWNRDYVCAASLALDPQNHLPLLKDRDVFTPELGSLVRPEATEGTQ
ncbi:hypothetical protein GCM10019016_121000 [Streptomyces prasinosporus]|uniref:Transposase n=1 Tax=Streptomyces prasinosporus TaxID=68256 RepID=A0ABP6UEC5_9ACTN